MQEASSPCGERIKKQWQETKKRKKEDQKKKARVLGVSYNVTVRLDAVHRGNVCGKSNEKQTDST